MGVHHSVIIRETKSNYGFNLSIWDRLFGTYLTQPSKGYQDGTTNCGALLATFGPQKNMIRCKRLSGEVACMLAEILEEHCMVSDTTGRKTKKADGLT